MERRVDTPGSCATENTGEGPESGEEMVVICGYLSGKKNGEIQIQSL